jgi:hypothetical protein
MGAFQERVQQLDERSKAGLPIGKLVKWIVIAAVVLGVVYYIFIVQGVRSVGDLMNMVRGFIP